MLKGIQNKTVSQINKFPAFKNKILQVINLYYKYAPMIFGNLIRNPAYIKNLINSKVIAGPGTLSFRGGAFNPGALYLDQNNILLLAKSQIIPWFNATGKNRKYYLKGFPVCFVINKTTLDNEKSSIVSEFNGFTNNDDYALEDFRLFNWKEKKMVNHSLMHKSMMDGNINLTSVNSALSVFDEKDNVLKFCAIPKLDFPIQEFEKNWVYKENGNQLFLFYSVNPYIVLSLEDEESFTFKTIINRQLSDKIKDPGGFKTMVSFSTNPIDYDDRNWLIIIHQIKFRLTARYYNHWAVLIDKSTLLPIQITSKPIFSGMGARGRIPGIRYISSILKDDDSIFFFAGEGDMYVTVTKKKISEIESLFVEI